MTGDRRPLPPAGCLLFSGPLAVRRPALHPHSAFIIHLPDYPLLFRTLVPSYLRTLSDFTCCPSVAIGQEDCLTSRADPLGPRILDRGLTVDARVNHNGATYASQEVTP